MKTREKFGFANADSIISRRAKDTRLDNISELFVKSGIAESMYKKLERIAKEGRDFASFGKLLHNAWLLKKEMKGASNENIDGFYKSAYKKGALGGKICGAGGRGFLLLYSGEGKNEVIDEMRRQGLQQLEFGFEKEGSKIVYDNETKR